MYKAIVVGTDGSERAGVAVNEAIALAKMNGATLHIVHAQKPLPIMGAEIEDGAATAALRDDLEKLGEEICSATLAEAKRAGVSAEAHNVPGQPPEVVVQVARGVSADLIVVGNRGMSSIKRFVLGSVPNKVSHNSPCSVLIVNTEPGSS